MYFRMSKVDTINIQSLVFSALLQIGDSKYVLPRSRALAVQREYPFFYGREGSFEAFDIFHMPLPRTQITEPIRMVQHHHCPIIKVGHVTVWGGSASSVIQVGSTTAIDSEARVKHIRQLRPRDERDDEDGETEEE